MNNEKKSNRLTDIITIIIFLCLIFIPAALFWITPDIKVSEDENRSLQQMPEFSLDNLISGKYTQNIGKYYADQFPFRNALVGAKTLFSYGFGINENKGAVIAKNGYLIQRYDKYSEKSIAEKSDDELGGDLTFDENMQNIKDNCGYINQFYENIIDLYPDINFTVAVPPRKIDVMTNKLPAFFPVDRHEKYFAELEKYINKNIYFDLLDVLKQHNEEYIYYRTDHHWTTYGAYWGYYAAAKNMGITPYELGRFNIEHAASDFRGTLFSKTLNFRITPDVIQFYTLSCDTENTTRLQINNGNEITEYDSLYLREYLDKKDKYAAFMGLNSPIMDVFTDVDNGKSLLIFKDSFAHCMIPFLANHYSRITVLDMRYINTDIEEFVALGDYGEILFVYSVTNFAEDSDLRKLAGN